MRNKCGELTALDAADFRVIRAHAKYRRLAGAAKLGEIFSLAVEHHPCNIRGRSCAPHVRQSGAADRLENDGVGMFCGGALNDVQELLALIDGIVASVADLDINAEALSGGFGGARLLDLKIIIVGDQRYQEAEPFHGRHAPREKETRV